MLILGVRKYPLGSGRTTPLLKNLDSLRKNKLTIDSLSSHESDLTIRSIKLGQLLEGSALTVCNPVILKITEGDRLCTGCRSRHECRSLHMSSKDRVRSTCNQRRLP